MISPGGTLTVRTLSSVVVCEGHPRWAPELQRQFAGQGLSVRSCRRGGDLDRFEATASVVVFDFDFAPADCLQYLGRRVGRRRDPPVVVIGSARTASLEWTVRDLGALAFLIDLPAGHDLASLCRRQWTVDGTSNAAPIA